MLKQNLIGDPYNGPHYNPPKETRKSPSPGWLPRHKPKVTSWKYGCPTPSRRGERKTSVKVRFGIFLAIYRGEQGKILTPNFFQDRQEGAHLLRFA